MGKETSGLQRHFQAEVRQRLKGNEGPHQRVDEEAEGHLKRAREHCGRPRQPPPNQIVQPDPTYVYCWTRTGNAREIAQHRPGWCVQFRLRCIHMLGWSDLCFRKCFGSQQHSRLFQRLVREATFIRQSHHSYHMHQVQTITAHGPGMRHTQLNVRWIQPWRESAVRLPIHQQKRGQWEPKQDQPNAHVIDVKQQWSHIINLCVENPNVDTEVVEQMRRLRWRQHVGRIPEK